MQNYYPLASSVTEVIFCFPGRYHVSVGTVHPSLLLSSSSSSSRWLSPNSIFRRIIGVISSHIHKLPQSRFPTPSLMLAICLQYPWCHHFSHGLFVCGRMPIYTSSSRPLPVCMNSVTYGSWADCILTLPNGVTFIHMYSVFSLDTFNPLFS